MVVMFPAIVALAVMLAGLTQATRITQWREQGIFQLATGMLPEGAIFFRGYSTIRIS